MSFLNWTINTRNTNNTHSKCLGEDSNESSSNLKDWEVFSEANGWL